MTLQELNDIVYTNTCCAAQIGYDYLLSKRKGIHNKGDFNRAVFLVGLCDLIADYIPEDNVNKGNKASVSFDINGLDVGEGGIIEIKDTTDTNLLAKYILPVTVKDNNKYAADMSALINDKNPAFYTYSANNEGKTITIYGGYDEDNGQIVKFNITGFVGQLLGGTTKILQKDNCTTTQQIESIIEIIERLCSNECGEEFINNDCSFISGIEFWDIEGCFIVS